MRKSVWNISKNDNIASRAVVVYTGEGGAADYTRGFVAYLVDDEGNVSEAIENGGTASFDYAENTLDYVAGTSEAVHTVYLFFLWHYEEGTGRGCKKKLFPNRIWSAIWKVILIR